MLVIKASPTHLIRLDPGEEVLTALTSYLRKERIQAGLITGIGAVKGTTLGYFDQHRREYSRRDFPGDMELVAFNANITEADGEPFIHAHAVLSGPDFTAYGGHLLRTEIAVTGEFQIWPVAARIERALDPRFHLKLIAGAPGEGEDLA